MKFQKSTFIEIKQMRELYKNGVSLSDISRLLKKNYNVINYWTKGYESNTNKPIIKIVKREIKGKRKVRIEIKGSTKLCYQCRKPKTDKHWILTHFCSLKCFSLLYPEINY